jgi:uncharacterized protein
VTDTQHAVQDRKALAKLGVGLLYNPSLAQTLHKYPESYDYVEVIPEMFWTDLGPEVSPRYVELAAWMEQLRWLAQNTRLVAHSLSFSLGSAGQFDLAPIYRLAEWNQRFSFAWHSEHLSFVRVPSGEGHDHNAALAVPVPYDGDVLEMFSDRIDGVMQLVPLNFLIENNVYFVDVPEQEMTEPQFLNQLHRRTGCGLLLDLHNLYTNARNHSFDALEFIDELDLSTVAEIHIAGGTELGGMWTDSHAGPVAEPVWDLLEYTVPHTPNLCGITFEFNDSYFPVLGEDGVVAELARARSAWDRLHPNL